MCRPASLGTTPSLIPTRSPKSTISTPESAALATASLAATLPATVASSALSTLSTSPIALATSNSIAASASDSIRHNRRITSASGAIKRVGHVDSAAAAS